jgi:surface antigen
MIRIFIILLLLSGCSQQLTKSHIGTVGGAVSGFTTCRSLLNSGMELTAACTLIGAWAGSNLFYKDDIHTHSAVFVDTLNSAPGERSHTYWSNSQTENWGSITVIRSYLVQSIKCTDYESVISISKRWPLNSVTRESEFGTACQAPDGRWTIVDVKDADERLMEIENNGKKVGADLI